MFVICRYSSRAMIIPFKEPTIGPKTTHESLAFAELTNTRKKASCVIGWVICLRKSLLQQGFAEIREMLTTTREKLPGVDPRLCMGYSCLLYFAHKVSSRVPSGGIIKMNSTFTYSFLLPIISWLRWLEWRMSTQSLRIFWMK